MLDLSKFRIYSLGTVTDNKPTDTDIVNCCPYEVIPVISGELKGSESRTIVASGTDASDAEYNIQLEEVINLPCKWLPLDTNKVTAPDMRRGENVIILQYADNDEYYFIPMGQSLKRLETAVWRFSGTADISDQELDENNCYQFIVSTHKKIISLTTSDANDEGVKFTVQINPGDKVLVAADDKGAFIQMDSDNDAITSATAAGANVTLNKDNIDIVANNIIGDFTGDFNITCANVNFNVGDAVTFNVSGDTTINAPNIILNGAVSVGSLASTSGPLSISSDIQSSEGASFTKPVTAPNI